MEGKTDLRTLSTRWASDSKTVENITLGWMLRIADATETMAKSRLELEDALKKANDNLKWMQDRYDRQQKELVKMTGSRNRYKKLFNDLKQSLT